MGKDEEDGEPLGTFVCVGADDTEGPSLFVEFPVVGIKEEDGELLADGKSLGA